jgi:hypothetical protein
MPSHVRNRYSQKNQEVYHQQALPVKNMANIYCLWIVCLPNICVCTWNCVLLKFLILIITQDYHTAQKIADDCSGNPRKSTLSFDFREANLDYQQLFLTLGQAYQEESLLPSSFRPPMNLTHADTVIAHPPLSNFQNPTGQIAPPLLECQMWTLLNKLFESDCARSANAVLLPRILGESLFVWQIPLNIPYIIKF